MCTSSSLFSTRETRVTYLYVAYCTDNKILNNCTICMFTLCESPEHTEREIEICVHRHGETENILN